jgi:hypothetical protein
MANEKEMVKEFLNILFTSISKIGKDRIIILYGSILEKFFKKYFPREDTSILNIYDLTTGFIKQYRDIFQIYGIYTDQPGSYENIYYKDIVIIINYHK